MAKMANGLANDLASTTLLQPTSRVDGAGDECAMWKALPLNATRNLEKDGVLFAAQ